MKSQLLALICLIFSSPSLSQEIGCYVEGECINSFAVGVADVLRDVDCHRLVIYNLLLFLCSIVIGFLSDTANQQMAVNTLLITPRITYVLPTEIVLNLTHSVQVNNFYQ